MLTARRTTAGVVPSAAGVLVALSVLIGGILAPAAATTDAGSTEPASWTSVDESVSTPPSELAAKVDSNDKARVVAVREGDGAPVFDVTEVKGKTQAESVVAQEQATDGTLAVAVEEKQRLVAAADSAAAATNDPNFGSQWGLSRLQAEASWLVSRGGGQTVAVVDTGVSPEPDLAPQLLTGWDYVAGHADGRSDANGHGTHVAGIIAATANNGVGGSGLAPSAKVLPVRSLDASGSGYWSDVANGIVYAVNQGAGVINLSLGGHSGNSSLQAAIDYATSNGRVVVAAAGNDGTSVPTYPAAYPGVIGVAASTQSDAVAGFSNSGSAVDVTAPGVGILSTVPGGYASMSGTSMAAPFVSATAALLRSAAVARGLGSVNVESVLASSATDIAAPGRDANSGAGLINPRNALCSVGGCSFGLKANVSLKRTTLTVRLNRAASQHVILQRKVGGKWKRVAKKVTAANGVASFKVKRGSSYRVVVPSTPVTLAVTSKSLRVR